MNKTDIAVAKLMTIRNSVKVQLEEDARGLSQDAVNKLEYRPHEISHHFENSISQLKVLKAEHPHWFGDYHEWGTTGGTYTSSSNGVFDLSLWKYSRKQVQQLVNDIGQALDLFARMNKTLGTGPSPAMPASSPTETKMIAPTSPLRRVFITHGHANDWREVQAYIEKDLELDTLELAQEPSSGLTIIEKLEANAAKCDSAVIVMSGDDLDAAGQARARENVMHEIGYFQAKFGRSRVILLHEEKVSVPTNLGGIVYVPYPKGNVSAGFAVMARELKSLYKD